MAKQFGGGDLRFRVAFDRRAETDDGLGNTQSDWVEEFQCRAAYRHLRGGETVLAGRLEGRHVQVISVRASRETRRITTEWRARDARTGDVFNIRDVTHETDRQWISLLVERGVAT
ncbi:head-tail adaptor protein [Aminobacter sp. BE322]|uniref:head-tail adaptor protein n=1 Tax=unclassified Aminobacter TaxID=2644704 RepID=UPI003D1A29FF